MQTAMCLQLVQNNENTGVYHHQQLENLLKKVLSTPMLKRGSCPDAVGVGAVVGLLERTRRRLSIEPELRQWYHAITTGLRILRAA